MITSAHCVVAVPGPQPKGNDDKIIEKVTVSLGSLEVPELGDGKGVEIEVKKDAITVHPDYKVNTLFVGNDMAILDLGAPVEITKEIKPICLPKGEVPAMGAEVTALGYGYTENLTQSDALKKGDTKVVDFDTGIDRLEELWKVEKNWKATKDLLLEMIPEIILGNTDEVVQKIFLEKLRSISNLTGNLLLTYNGKTSICTGDDGGPLVFKDGEQYALAGVATFTFHVCHAGNPEVGLFNRVDHYVDWIKESIA